jgi:hypothetical protein
VEDTVCRFRNHFLEQQPEVGSLAVVRRGDVFDATGVGRELEAFPEGSATAVSGIVDGDALATIPRHHCEARHIRGAIPYIDHVFKWDRPVVGRHVVVDVLVIVQHALVDAEKELSLSRVRDGALGEADATLRILTVFALRPEEMM